MIASKYVGAYHEMLHELSPHLSNPISKNTPPERLDFKADLPRGDKKLIYQAIAKLLSAADSNGTVAAKGYSANDVIRWFANPSHSNLGVNFQSLQRLVYQELSSVFNGLLTDDSKC